jgi:hypothetical protein
MRSNKAPVDICREAQRCGRGAKVGIGRIRADLVTRGSAVRNSLEESIARQVGLLHAAVVSQSTVTGRALVVRVGWMVDVKSIFSPFRMRSRVFA